MATSIEEVAMNVRYRVELSEVERGELRAMLSGGKRAARKLKRAQILLAADAGVADETVAISLDVGVSTVSRVKRRFVEGGVERALDEEPRPGAARKLTGKEEALLVATACASPPEGRARWTLERFCQVSRHRPWPMRVGLAIWPALTAGWGGMRCIACGSEAVTERPERTAQGYRRFRCCACGKQSNERSGGRLNRTQYPSDVIALVVLWRLRYKLALRDLPEMFLVRGLVFSHEAVRAWEAKLTPVLAEHLRRRRKGKVGRSWYVDETYLKVGGRWCYLYRAIDRSGALVDVLFSEQRDMAAAEAFFRSAKAVTGVTPDRVTTDGHDSYPRAIRSEFGKGVRHRTSGYLNNRLEIGQSQMTKTDRADISRTTAASASSTRTPAGSRGRSGSTR